MYSTQYLERVQKTMQKNLNIDYTVFGPASLRVGRRKKKKVGYRPQLNNINMQPIQDSEVRTTDPQDPSAADSTMALQNRKCASEGHIWFHIVSSPILHIPVLTQSANV